MNSERNEQALQAALQEEPQAVSERLPKYGEIWQSLDSSLYPSAVRLGDQIVDGRSFGVDVRSEALLRGLAKIPVDADGTSALCQIMEDWPLELSRMEERSNPLFPSSMVFSRPDHPQAGKLTRPALWSRDGAAVLPGFGPDLPEGPVVPALPLALYELAAGEGSNRGHGAPLAARIFVDAVTSVPVDDRQSDRPVLLPPMSLREFLKRLYPNPRAWRRRNHLKALMEAFVWLESPQSRVPWEDPKTGAGGLRRVVWPADLPRSGRMDDVVRFGVHFPPGTNSRGVIFDRRAALLAGVESGVAWRLLFSLATWWNQPGRTIVPVGRGKSWRQARKVDRYPEVSDSTLTAMAFPAGGSRHGLQRAEKALDYLVRIGYAVVHPTCRILPGDEWAGWNVGSTQEGVR